MFFRVSLANSIAFDPADPRSSLLEVPETPGIFALYAADRAAEPYLGKATNLRRRLTRFLRAAKTAESSAAPLSKRLELAHLVARVEYSVTGSELESSLVLYEASLAAFGDRARRRLRTPVFLRMSSENAYPRVYATTRISKAAAGSLFGPFPSRAAAERYAEETLNLFLLRRCTENLAPDPAFPGCVYSEMKMCLAPCYRGCTDERYHEEATAVSAFLSTRGASLVARIEDERNRASEGLEFERAAELHQRMQKVRTVIELASAAVRPLSQLNGILVQPAAALPSGKLESRAALFGLREGFLAGPVLYSTKCPSEAHLEMPHLDEALSDLERLSAKSRSSQVLCDHLALFTRWYYSPFARRTGEAIFTGSDGHVPRKALLRAIARSAVGAGAAGPASE